MECAECKWYGIFTCECPYDCNKETKKFWEKAEETNKSKPMVMARYIDANELKRKIKSRIEYFEYYYPDRTEKISELQNCLELVEKAQTEDVQVQPVIHGEWIDDYGSSWKCSVCGTETYVDEDFRTADMGAYKMRYCHFCGAKMQSGIDRSANWVKVKEDSEIFTICSNCGKTGRDQYEYCPHCGFKMGVNSYGEDKNKKTP